MKIENTGKPIASTAAGETRPRSPANATATVASSPDKVELSSLSASLQKAETVIAKTPEMDMKRVAEIKQAISNGEFKIDAGRIADGLITSVREMLAGQR
ncbi:MAG: flagellar biosynthesis anti-sigma factor FlgM [Phycisphaerae bacterium]|nr:flagellar biosynthesis anti-sigma factor FlgM [Phycisphaerae bacterium]